MVLKKSRNLRGILVKCEISAEIFLKVKKLSSPKSSQKRSGGCLEIRNQEYSTLEAF